MPGSGTVNIVIANNTAGPLTPFGNTAIAVTGGKPAGNPQTVPDGEDHGHGGGFRVAAESTQAVKGVVVYECPDKNKVILMFAQFLPQGNTSTNIVKVGIYDRENTTVNEALVKHISENQNAKGDIAYKYTDKNGYKFLLTIKASTKNEDDNAEATFTVDKESRPN